MRCRLGFHQQRLRPAKNSDAMFPRVQKSLFASPRGCGSDIGHQKGSTYRDVLLHTRRGALKQFAAPLAWLQPWSSARGME
jgi:hypothetical protein